MWTAVLVAALLSNPMIDVVAVKGELLALPFVLGQHPADAARRTAPRVAARARGRGRGRARDRAQAEPRDRAGLRRRAAAGRVADRAAARPLGRGLGGAGAGRRRACPCSPRSRGREAAGVRLSTLWDTVYGFRADAARVIADGTTDAPERRAWILLAIALGHRAARWCSSASFAHLRELWRDDPPVRRGDRRGGRRRRGLARRAAAASGRTTCSRSIPGRRCARRCSPAATAGPGARCAGSSSPRSSRRSLAMAFWLVWNATGHQEFDEVRTGEAIAECRGARRHPRGLRRPRRPPAGQRPELAVPLSVEPADAHPRPGVRRPHGAARRPGRPDLAGRVGRPRRLGRRRRARAARTRSTSTTSRSAPPATASRSTCSVASTGPRSRPTAPEMPSRRS